MINLTINGRSLEIAEGRTLLEACREYAIHIPTLCFHPALEPYGACRLCMVEIIQGARPPRLVAACTYPCESGLHVQTESEAVQHSRRMTAELLLAGAWNTPEILTLAETLGVKEARYRLPVEDACILCALCVRACQEIVGVNAISFIQRGIQKKVSPPFQVASSVCIACGTCTLICPTGAIQLIEIHTSAQADGHPYCQLCSDFDQAIPRRSPQNRYYRDTFLSESLRINRNQETGA